MPQESPADRDSRPSTPSEELLDRLDSAVMLASAEGAVRYANAPMGALLGLRRYELVGASTRELLPPPQSLLGRSIATVISSRRQLSTFGWDAYLRCWLGIRVYPSGDGLELHVRVVSSSERPIESSDGVGDVVVPIDTVAIPMLVIDADGVIRYANQASLDLLGYDRDNHVDHPLADFFVHPAFAHDLLSRIHQGEALQDVEVELWHQNGQIRTVLATTNPPPDEAPEGYTQCYLRDITAQREAEERDARLAAVVQSSNDAIIAKRLDGIITSWNPAAERLYGYTSEEAVGQPITLIIPAEREGEFPQIMSRLARGEHIDHYDTVRRAKDGRMIDVSVSIAPIRSRTGRIIGAASIARNVTERRMLERKQREFLTMVAHDLRSPLTSIKGFAQLMERRQAYSAAGVTAILSQTRQMERLVGDVLEITRLDENRQDLDLTEVNLVEIARQVTDRARDLRQGDGIRLVAPPEPMLGMWDEVRLAQVFDNLLSNAIKYAPDGEILVSLRRGADAAEVVVEDHGPGIAPDALPYIFDRFYRVPGEHSVGRGVGLGLSITKALIEAHGGTIDVTSQVGSGTRFTVTLPWDATRDASAAD